MSQLAKLISEQLKDIIEDQMKFEQGAREVQKHMDDKHDLESGNTSSELNRVFTTINNKFEHKCIEEVVRLLNAYLICQSIHDHVPGQMYSIPDLPGLKSLVPQDWAMW